MKFKGFKDFKDFKDFKGFKGFKDTKYGDLSGQTYDGDIALKGLNLTSLEGVPKKVNG